MVHPSASVGDHGQKQDGEHPVLVPHQGAGSDRSRALGKVGRASVAKQPQRIVRGDDEGRDGRNFTHRRTLHVKQARVQHEGGCGDPAPGTR